MNDDELMTLVRAQRDQVPMTVPLEDIVRRGIKPATSLRPARRPGR